jgi:hypothetical protein
MLINFMLGLKEIQHGNLTSIALLKILLDCSLKSKLCHCRKDGKSGGVKSLSSRIMELRVENSISIWI